MLVANSKYSENSDKEDQIKKETISSVRKDSVVTSNADDEPEELHNYDKVEETLEDTEDSEEWNEKELQKHTL